LLTAFSHLAATLPCAFSVRCLPNKHSDKKKRIPLVLPDEADLIGHRATNVVTKHDKIDGKDAHRPPHVKRAKYSKVPSSAPSPTGSVIVRASSQRGLLL
jgi:hypothetical protein